MVYLQHNILRWAWRQREPANLHKRFRLISGPLTVTARTKCTITEIAAPRDSFNILMKSSRSPMSSTDFQELFATIAMENATLKERVAALEQGERRNGSRLFVVMLSLMTVFLLLGSQYFLRQTFSGRWWAIH